MKTTFQKIKDNDPCSDGWNKLIRSVKNFDLDTEVSIKQILDSNGIGDAVWALRAFEMPDKEARLFIADVAEISLQIYKKHCPNGLRPRHAIEVARKFANGEITETELASASAAARAASRNTAWAASIYAASAAAWAASSSAARVAAWDASSDAARAAAWDAGSVAGSVATWEKIETLFKKYFLK